VEIVGEVQSPNILNWYPFKENQKIKEIKNIEEIDLCNEKFDVIILVGIFENQNIKLKELIKKVEKILEEKGKILITIDNKFGLEAFNGTPDKIYKKKFASLTGYNNEQNKRETYTKSSIENEIRKLGYNMRFYYPLPDYKNPNVIFTDEQLPEYNSIDKYHPYYIENNDITFNEIDVFREILKTDKNMFTFFANSFLIEITKGECDKTYKYISFNNIRKEIIDGR
jgi:SAM-dependent methyltransferase